MSRPRATRLREVENAPVSDAAVIDAQFKVVGRKRRILRALWRGLLAVCAAALIGFLIPPAWVVIQAIGDWIAQR